MSRTNPLTLLLLYGLAGCTGNPADPTRPDMPASTDLQASADLQDGGTPVTGDPQTPPLTGGATLMTWLQAGYYKSWHCEAAAHPAGPNGAHGVNRICSNNLLAAATGTGEYPVGSASVKELYSGTSISAYAISVRATAGPSPSAWYWNEFGSGGFGIPGCAGCHSQAGTGTFAGHDSVFVRVQ